MCVKAALQLTALCDKSVWCDKRITLINGNVCSLLSEQFKNIFAGRLTICLICFELFSLSNNHQAETANWKQYRHSTVEGPSCWNIEARAGSQRLHKSHSAPEDWMQQLEKQTELSYRELR